MTCPFKERPGYRSVAVIGPNNHVSAFFSNVKDAKEWAGKSPSNLEVFIKDGAGLTEKDSEIEMLKQQVAQFKTDRSSLADTVLHQLHVIEEKNTVIARRELALNDAEKELVLVKACLANRDHTISHQRAELDAIHAAHRAAVQHWDDAEAVNKVLRKEVEVLHTQLCTRIEQLDKLTQKHNAYKASVLASGYTDQSAEIKRLKLRVNSLILTLDQIRNQTSHAQRETL